MPAPFADPHKLIIRAGNTENLATAGSGWIVIDYLDKNRSTIFRSQANCVLFPLAADSLLLHIFLKHLHECPD